MKKPSHAWKARRATKWTGLCPAGKHGLDYKGQPCDLCSKGNPNNDGTETEAQREARIDGRR